MGKHFVGAVIRNSQGRLLLYKHCNWIKLHTNKESNRKYHEEGATA